MTKRRNARWQQIAMRAGHGILTVYFIIMTVVFPLYMQDGYLRIGNVKYFFFRHISLMAIGIMLPISILLFWLQKKEITFVERYKRLSVTDWFVYGYLIAVLLSYLFTDYKKEAVWGTDGWYMGMGTQLLFVGIYFLFSRYFKWNGKKLGIVLISSGLVFFLGILNRYSIYPVELYGQQPGFISTLGNINWFCGYWSVFCPIGVMGYWNCMGGWRQTAAAVYVVIAFLSGVTQGSSSAYLVFAVIFIFLFSLSFRDNQKMKRFLQLSILFALSCQIARIFRYLPGFMLNYENDLGAVLTDTNASLYMGMAAGAVYSLFDFLAGKRNYKIEEHKKIRKIVLILLGFISVVFLSLLIANTYLPGGILGLSGVSCLTFDETWANGRGAAWSSGFAAYRSMPFLQKLVGVGADCFAEYIYNVPELAEPVYERFGNYKLTNTHNEWLTMLVNQGALGLACYIGIFFSAFRRFMKNAEMRPVLYLCAAGILSYTAHNMVSFQQVLNTPFVFIILGIGEGGFQIQSPPIQSVHSFPQRQNHIS